MRCVPQSTPHAARSVTATPRSGYVIVFFAMILFGIMGLAALVIDVGFARLTQRQMKQATDVAALEALRTTDVDSDDPDIFLGRTADTELGRRQMADDMVTVLFDDDFDATADSRNFGAGPQLNLTGGIPLNDGFSASQLLTLPAAVSYKPALEQNVGNDAAGDVVTTATDVTVRLRRDNTGTLPGVRSNGGAVPFLFARGTLMSSATKAAGVQLDVRSVSSTRPVVRIGAAQTVGGVTMPGGISFGIARSVWESLTENTATPTPLATDSVGTTVDGLGNTTILREVGADVRVLPVAQTADGYCAVFESIGGNLRVIGFGWIQITPDPIDAANILITKHGGDAATGQTVAAENATARLSEAWDALAPLSESDREDVISANQSFSDPLVSPVLQPGG